MARVIPRFRLYFWTQLDRHPRTKTRAGAPHTEVGEVEAPRLLLGWPRDNPIMQEVLVGLDGRRTAALVETSMSTYIVLVLVIV